MFSFHYFTVTQILGAGLEAVWGFFSLLSSYYSFRYQFAQSFLKYVKQKNPYEIPLFCAES